jgi:hypothetical protein
MVTLVANLVIWIVTALLIGWAIRGKMSKRRLQLVYIGIGYVLSLGAFGHVYSYLYGRNHNAFAFASDVLATRHHDIVDEKSNELGEAKVFLTAVDQLRDQLQHHNTQMHFLRTDDNFVEIETADFHYDLNFDATWSGRRRGKLFRAARLSVTDRNGKYVGVEQVDIEGPNISLQKTLPQKQWEAMTDAYFPPATADKLLQMLEPVCLKLDNSVNVLTEEVKRRTTKSSNTVWEEWTYLDFFYFSTITQTTVGYGDILPNSSTVRVFVIVQVLIGLVLLGIAVNWIASGD